MNREDEETAHADLAEEALRAEVRRAAEQARDVLAGDARARAADRALEAQANDAIDRFRQLVTPKMVLALLDAHEADLRDMSFVVEQVSKVYRAITGGLLSQPTYYAETVIAVADDRTNETVEDLLREQRETLQGPPLTAPEHETLLAKTRACQTSLRQRLEQARDLTQAVRAGKMPAADAIEIIAHYLEVLPDAPEVPATPA